MADALQKWEQWLEENSADENRREFDAAELAKATQTELPNSAMEEFLSRLAEAGSLERVEAFRCPNQTCGSLLDEGMTDVGTCPYCHFTFVLDDEQPIPVTRYIISGIVTRDIRWMIVIHGMNSAGAWQETLSWLIANHLKYSAPVLIYKCGWLTLSVASRVRHRQLVKALGEKIRRAMAYANKRQPGSAPDIVLHSFGTLLFTKLLLDHEFSDLKFGRIITAGSIIRPDFDWNSLIRTGRIEGVLNHVGGKDRPVLFAQYFIPNSGPSGRVGYLDQSVTNIFSDGFGHSGCFTEEYLSETLSRKGDWYRFLTRPLGTFGAQHQHRPTSWKPASRLIRYLTLSFGLIVDALTLPP